MNTDLQLKFNNSYHVELIDSTTGETKQSGDFHNLVTNNMGHPLTGAYQANTVLTNSTSGSYYTGGIICFRIKVGSGTAEPTVSDTALGSLLWTGKPTIKNARWVDDYTLRVVYTTTFPATSSYVGNVTEIGVFSGYDGYSSFSGDIDAEGLLVTHSLLTDSEGQVISFNKTDLDILVIDVTIEVSVISASQDFAITKRPRYLINMMNTINADIVGMQGTTGYVNLCRFHSQVEAKHDRTALEVSLSSTVQSYFRGRTGYIDYSVVRLGTDNITSDRYYKAIALPGLGYWKLPNENVFPAYNIKGISIGVGDGAATQFTCPLSYFKKDSEVIYKNGTPLTRGVDYTVNHQGNKGKLHEIAEQYLPTKVTSAATSSNTLLYWQHLFKPPVVGFTSGPKWFSSSAPLYFEYAEPVTLNYLTAYNLVAATSSSTTSVPSGTKYHLDYSTDGETYKEIAVHTSTSSATASSFTMEFTATTAKYWRLRISNYTAYPIGLYDSSNSAYISVMYLDPYITFVEAPAAGDVLTMDVGMDLIMKNSNFVVDVGARVDVTW